MKAPCTNQPKSGQNRLAIGPTFAGYSRADAQDSAEGRRLGVLFIYTAVHLHKHKHRTTILARRADETTGLVPRRCLQPSLLHDLIAGDR
jgi:hypothetical protein